MYIVFDRRNSSKIRMSTRSLATDFPKQVSNKGHPHYDLKPLLFNTTYAKLIILFFFIFS